MSGRGSRGREKHVAEIKENVVGKSKPAWGLGMWSCHAGNLTSLGRLGLDCLRARRPLLGGTGVLPSSRSTRPSSRAWKASRVSDFLWAHTVCPTAARLSSQAEPPQTQLPLSLPLQISTSSGLHAHHSLSLTLFLSLQPPQLSCSAASLMPFSHYSLHFPPSASSHPTHLHQDTSLVSINVPFCPVPPTLEPLMLLQPRPKQHCGLLGIPDLFLSSSYSRFWIPGEH